MSANPPILARSSTELAPEQIDRRRPGGWEPVHLDPEGVLAALEEARRIENGRRDEVKGCTTESMVVIALTAYVETARAGARRGAFFPLRGGLRVEGVHPEDVQAALAVVNRHGGLAIDGPQGEETIARALAAALGSQETRVRRSRSQHRRGGGPATVAHRVAIHRAGR